MNQNFHDGHKYSVSEIETMRSLLPETDRLKRNAEYYEHCFKYGTEKYYHHHYEENIDYEERLRTLMLNGTTVKELQAIHDEWKARCQTSYEHFQAREKIEREAKKARQEEARAANEYDAAQWTGNPGDEPAKWWRFW